MLVMNWGDPGSIFWWWNWRPALALKTFLVVSSAQLNDKFTHLIATDCYACYYIHIWKLLNCTAFFLKFFSFISCKLIKICEFIFNWRIIALQHCVGFYQTSTFSSVQSLSRVRLFATPWITAHQASLSITNSQSSLRLMSIESVMPSSHLILCHPLLLLPPIPPSIRVFSSDNWRIIALGYRVDFCHTSTCISQPYSVKCKEMDNHFVDCLL